MEEEKKTTHGLSSWRKVEAAMASPEINVELVCPQKISNFRPGIYDYDAKRHNLIWRVTKCMISSQEAHTKFNKYCKTIGSQDVYSED